MTTKIKTRRNIDPALVEMLPVLKESDVMEFLSKAGTKAVTVVFSSVDGKKAAEVKSRNGLMRAASRLVGNARGAAQSDAMKARGQVWGAKPAGGSFSFYADRVHELRGGGMVLTAKGFAS